MTDTLTRQTAKVVLLPVIHEAGTRVTRRAWQAFLAERSYTGTDFRDKPACPHTHGHRTQQAAVDCGTVMWKRLPAA